MALAHRHARGVGVPKSCRAAALYYNPAAEKVVESVDAAVPGISPSVEKHRLRRVVCTVVYEYARVSPAFLPASTQL
jgi:SEL1 protein